MTKEYTLNELLNDYPKDYSTAKKNLQDYFKLLGVELSDLKTTHNYSFQEDEKKAIFELLDIYPDTLHLRKEEYVKVSLEIMSTFYTQMKVLTLKIEDAEKRKTSKENLLKMEINYSSIDFQEFIVDFATPTVESPLALRALVEAFQNFVKAVREIQELEDKYNQHRNPLPNGTIGMITVKELDLQTLYDEWYKK